MTARPQITFRKQRTCPSGAALLQYKLGQLGADYDACIADHLERCDFCGAELQLLAQHPQDAGSSGPSAEIPLPLKQLAEALLQRV